MTQVIADLQHHPTVERWPPPAALLPVQGQRFSTSTCKARARTGLHLRRMQTIGVARITACARPPQQRIERRVVGQRRRQPQLGKPSLGRRLSRLHTATSSTGPAPAARRSHAGDAPASPPRPARSAPGGGQDRMVDDHDRQRTTTQAAAARRFASPVCRALRLHYLRRFAFGLRRFAFISATLCVWAVCRFEPQQRAALK